MLRFLYFFLVGFFLFSCHTVKKEKKDIDFINESIDYQPPSSSENYIKKAKFIFYNMSSPIEMAQVFENSETNFNHELLFNYNNYSNYSSSKKIALVLGIYGVDMSYLRMFEQTQLSIKYFAVIKELSNKLGVPDDYINLTSTKIEKNISNKDSLFKIANQIYLEANTYLKGNERENTASLILLGGWVEALYIATSIIEQENSDKNLLKKIADQKYSLNSLISLLLNNVSDKKSDEYVVLLNSLKGDFSKLDVSNLSDEEAESALPELVDNKVIDNSNQELIKNIHQIIIEIRNRIIS